MMGVLLLLVAYLLGSIPTSVWVGKSFYGIDVREHGSNNAGATNTFRVLGKTAGSIVFIVDVLKGTVAVVLMIWATKEVDGQLASLLRIGAGVLAVLGHVFPIFAGFRGGKGVATSLGVILALAPIAAVLCMAVFLIIWLGSNYVSLGSIIAASCFPLMQFFIYPDDTIVTVFSILLATLVIWAHRKNIQRLKEGNETKTFAFRKKTIEH